MTEALFQLYPQAFAYISLEKMADGKYTNRDVLVAARGFEEPEKFLPYLQDPADGSMVVAAAILASHRMYGAATTIATSYINSSNETTRKMAWEVLSYCAAMEGQPSFLKKSLKNALETNISWPPERAAYIPVLGFLIEKKPIAFLYSLSVTALEGYYAIYYYSHGNLPYAMLTAYFLIDHLRSNCIATKELLTEEHKKRALSILKKKGKLKLWLFNPEQGCSF